MDQQLLAGILLIIVGVALGLIVAAVIVNRRIDASERAAESGERPAELERGTGDDDSPAAEPAAEPEPAGAGAGLSGSQAKTPAPKSDTLLGELYRDPSSGALIFRSGVREYRSAGDISDRSEHERLARAAAQWSAWFEQSSKSAVDSPSGAGIVQAIDEILQRSLQSVGESSRGVRLIQDTAGGVKVLIGVKSYEVEQVPDEEIRRLIRQAVAEWEARQ